MKKPDKASKQRLENVESKLSVVSYIQPPLPGDLGEMSAEEATDYYLQTIRQPVPYDLREVLKASKKVSQEEAARIYYQIMQ